MKHSPTDFAAHVLGLLKNRGTTGPSGTNPPNAFNPKGKFGTGDLREVVPVDSHRYQSQNASGTAKDKKNQSLSKRGTGGTGGTPILQQAADLPASGGGPASWHTILAELEGMGCPDRLAPGRWDELLSDAEIFLSRWGSPAHALGWTALDLFGVHPIAPAARFDVMGLLLLIQGGEILALTADAATIRRKTGAVLTYRRPALPGAVLLSAVQS
jgi:hypothetical protein